MNIKKIRLPILIIAIGIIVAIAAYLLTSIVKAPTVTEQDFNYSVTYKLNGETKKLAGVYKCRFDGYGGGDSPLERYYTGEYVVDGIADPSRKHTVANVEGLELYIVVLFNDSYLMGDEENEYYESSLADPHFEAIDEEGMQYDDEETLSVFNAEIVSWDYPEPIENTFVFAGFSRMHTDSMLAMILVGFLVIAACAAFVKKEDTVSYTSLDNLSVVLNFVVTFAVIPFIALIVGFLPLTMSTSGVPYQIFTLIPALTAFTVAASVSLRRIGFSKSGFFTQLVCPALFLAYLAVESLINNLFL